MKMTSIEKTLISIVLALNPRATVSDLAKILNDYPRLAI